MVYARGRKLEDRQNGGDSVHPAADDTIVPKWNFHTVHAHTSIQY